MDVKKLSIVIPCYNEKATIAKILEEIMAVDLGKTKKEILIVDDYSKDTTRAIIKKIAEKNKSLRVILQDKNRGKGAAVKRGLLETTGDIVIIQDADLEYDPQDYKRLLVPFKRGQADVVYGSRFIGGEPHRIIYLSNKIANKCITLLSNVLSGTNLSDVETCYKMMEGGLARSIAKDLKSDRFGFDPEITTRLAKSRARIFEVGISYYGRSKAEGKKIGLKDGLKTIWEIFYFNITVRKKSKNA